MRRRHFIALLGSAAVALPPSARGQRQAIPVIGYLSAQSFNAAFPARQAAFVRGLKETGYIERENVTIEYVSAEGRYDRLPAMARQLVSRKVDLIASTGGAPASLAAKGATSTIPIVIVTGDDAVKSGLVESLNRPGGNVTGVSFLTSALGAKRLGLLQDLVPTTKSFALLVNPTSPEAEPYTNDVQGAARAIGKPLQLLNAGTEDEINAAFAALAGQRDLVLVVGADAYFTSRRDQIVTLAARALIPAIYANRDIAEGGGLMSYGPDLTEQYRQAGVYAGRILKGEKPATMPVLQPTKFEFVINLKAAKALGLTIPSGIMAIADEVIE
jgi:putative ABC transport system substrate-binding protein